MNAKDSVTLTATDIAATGKDSKTTITAGNDITLNTVTQLHGGDISLNAGRDMNATAATVDAKNALTVTAGRDITIQSGKDVSDLTEHSKQTSKGLLDLFPFFSAAILTEGSNSVIQQRVDKYKEIKDESK
ncbi:hemagglutinin repeat-containing protein [Morganella morganii]|nr:hemagglutinin repeat-containing protein [Morganella morganii]EKU5841745.1 hemagglutinin repeat-containing protein [Morganella morganii]WNP32559.1 hemagglutinin repeat-containing protein [Morganella morganii]